MVTCALCLARFALTSSSQAAGSSDWGNLDVQAWDSGGGVEDGGGEEGDWWRGGKIKKYRM